MKNIAGMERRTKIVCTIGPATSSRAQLRALLERVILRERFWSFTLVVGIGFLLLVLLAVGAWLAALGGFFAHLLPVPAVVLGRQLRDLVLRHHVSLRHDL